ncbi:hypothetical protein A5634_09345 [Mycobacterium asiaticum]|uniref:Uncharacterized protein n=1 Tax=Mycobacterium asiaticum TaxID=1790 RepID=A0A1A3NL66_MYCAS|nr:DUF3618 domain-containing protein [Mycobacterium asiaticum]OBK21784.1 hypothetical protein A5634_09345 [Mycobacterium asiaticum]
MTGAERTPKPSTPEPGPDAEVADIKADIEQTRAELGATVQALSAKVDVPARAREKAQAAKPTLALAAAGAAVALAALLWWRRRRS